MPWMPELFSAPAVAALEEKRRHELVTVPFFDGVLAGEFDALVKSFAGEPELHHPVRGRIKGVRAFETYVTDTRAWLGRLEATVEDVDHVVAEGKGFEEVVLHLHGDGRRVDLPMAVVAAKRPDGRIDELRIYYSSWPLTGRNVNRPPLLQVDPELRAPGVVADYLRALAAGDAEAMLAAFEADGYAREPSGAQFVHAGREELHAFYKLLFSNGGGVRLEQCALVDDRRACALEYNVTRWGTTELPPQAGLVVLTKGQAGKLAAARMYDDVDRPLRYLQSRASAAAR